MVTIYSSISLSSNPKATFCVYTLLITSTFSTVNEGHVRNSMSGRMHFKKIAFAVDPFNEKGIE